MSDQDTPDEQEIEEQRRASAQRAAGDLDRMGIDPRVLGLDVPRPRDAPQASHSDGQPASDEGGQPPRTDTHAVPGRPQPSPSVPEPPTHPANVTMLRPDYPPPAPESGPPAPPGPSGPPAPPGRPIPPPSGPQAAASPPQPPPEAPQRRWRTPVERMLAATAGDLPAPSRTGGVLKQMTFGLMTPDSAEASAHERDLVAALRTRQTERRVVSFFAGKGGVGTTTVVTGVGVALAALREENTVAVDVRPGTASLGQLVGVEQPVTVRRFLNEGDDARVAVSPTGLHVLDGVGWEQQLRRVDISAAAERLGADHTFTLLDVGNDASEVGHAAVARSDQTVIVGSAGRTGFAALEVAMARVAHTDPFALDRAIFVVVCQHDEAYRNVYREAVRLLSVDDARLVVIAPDDVLASGHGFDAAAVRGSTRTAMLRIGAALAASGGRQ